MLFNTLAYAKFFAVVFVVFLFLRGFRKARLLFLLGASYFFYAHWDWRFLPLIFASSTVDFWLGRLIGNESDPRRRKWLLIGTVVINLGLLGFFKYFNFVVASLKGVLGGVAELGRSPAVPGAVGEVVRQLLEPWGGGAPQLGVLEIALPIGISFFTFESMSYVIDVYRKQLEPHRSYTEYLTFVAFFPHLVAGPIVRPRDLLPQLAASARFNAAEASEGVFLVALGLLKKVGIADFLAVNLVDRVFDAPVQYSGLECYAAVVAYAVQIYCDFSGYTDIAIGSALLLGIRFPFNFNSPYQADSLQEFWRRWHISLSTWLRDYLYIPLGGNRQGEGRAYLNLMLTMLLGGLWHGANWTFVAWGGLHGVGLCINRLVAGRGGGTSSPELWETALRPPGFMRRAFQPAGIGLRTLKVFATFHFVCVTWVFFRAPSFDIALALFRRLSTLTTYHPNLPLAVVLCLGLGLAGHFVPRKAFQAMQAGFIRAPAVAQAVCLFAVSWLLAQVATTEAVPFVYFQF